MLQNKACCISFGFFLKLSEKVLKQAVHTEGVLGFYFDKLDFRSHGGLTKAAITKGIYGSILTMG